MYYIVIFVIHSFICFLVAKLAQNNGKSFVYFFFVSFFTSAIVGLIIFLTNRGSDRNAFILSNKSDSIEYHNKEKDEEIDESKLSKDEEASMIRSRLNVLQSEIYQMQKHLELFDRIMGRIKNRRFLSFIISLSRISFFLLLVFVWLICLSFTLLGVPILLMEYIGSKIIVGIICVLVYIPLWVLIDKFVDYCIENNIEIGPYEIAANATSEMFLNKIYNAKDLNPIEQQMMKNIQKQTYQGYVYSLQQKKSQLKVLMEKYMELVNLNQNNETNKKENDIITLQEFIKKINHVIKEYNNHYLFESQTFFKQYTTKHLAPLMDSVSPILNSVPQEKLAGVMVENIWTEKEEPITFPEWFYFFQNWLQLSR